MYNSHFRVILWKIGGSYMIESGVLPPETNIQVYTHENSNFCQKMSCLSFLGGQFGSF